MFVQDRGLLSMPMYLGPIVGPQMCVGRNAGFCCLRLKSILCSTGVITVSCTISSYIHVYIV